MSKRSFAVWPHLGLALLALITAMGFQMSYLILSVEDRVAHSGFSGILYYWQVALSGYTISSCATFFLTFYLFYRCYHSHFFVFSKRILTFSVFFALCMVVGASYRTSDSSALLTTLPFSVVQFVGYSSLFYFILCVLMELPEFLQNRRHAASPQLSAPLFAHPFRTPCLIIAICWLPWLITYLPGSVYPDSFGQIEDFLHLNPVWTAHHPPFSSMLMGTAMTIGQWFGSDNLGILLFMLLQAIASCAAFGWSIRFLQEVLHAPRSIVLGALLFFCFCTVWPSYAQCVVKDTLFYALVLVYILQYSYYLFFAPSPYTIRQGLVVFVLGILVALLRNNGIYMLVCSFPFLCFMGPKSNKKVFRVACLGILAAYLAFNKVVCPALGITKGGTQEMLSIPFQQTARYVKYYGDEVTEQEKNAIAGVLDYDNLGELYSPICSDNVKGTYHWAYGTDITKPGEKEALQAYFRVWFQQFLKHPTCYIDATLNNTYGWFYPDGLIPVTDAGYYEISTYSSYKSPGPAFDVHYILPWNSLRAALSSVTGVMSKLPGICLLYHAGSYFWVLFFLCFYALYKHRYRWFALLLPFLSLFLVCIASPVNGYLRYALPLAACTPWLLALYGSNATFKPSGH